MAGAATKVDASWAATNASMSMPMPMAKHAVIRLGVVT